MKLGASSLEKLRGVHPDLVRVIKRAAEISKVDFMVVEGLRTLERQKQLKAAGASTILNSRHITGHAVDIVPMLDGKARWDWPMFHRLAPFVLKAAKQVGVRVEWGGDWTRFPDGPHWQLPRRTYK